MMALFRPNLSVVEVEDPRTRLMNEIILKLSLCAEITVARAAMDRGGFTCPVWDIQADCPASFAVELVIEKSARHLSTVLL